MIASGMKRYSKRRWKKRIHTSCFFIPKREHWSCSSLYPRINYPNFPTLYSGATQAVGTWCPYLSLQYRIFPFEQLRDLIPPLAPFSPIRGVLRLPPPIPLPQPGLAARLLPAAPWRPLLQPSLSGPSPIAEPFGLILHLLLHPLYLLLVVFDCRQWRRSARRRGSGTGGVWADRWSALVFAALRAAALLALDQLPLCLISPFFISQPKVK